MHLAKTRDFIINWLANFANQNSITHFIVGVSGGIDSALTSTLCSMSNINTIVVSMPIHQKKIELDNALKHCKWLHASFKNASIHTIDLTQTFEQYKNTIPSKFQSPLALANSRARLRMITLYQIASSTNGLVVGTGNKIEDFGIGFFTKYGDGGVDISPIADLKKTEVNKLANFCGIDQGIINAPPTDGLWDDGRNDEDQIGASYKELEWAMDFKGNSQLSVREKEVLAIYNKLHNKNRHKMTPIPICHIPKDFLS